MTAVSESTRSTRGWRLAVHSSRIASTWSSLAQARYSIGDLDEPARNRAAAHQGPQLLHPRGREPLLAPSTRSSARSGCFRTWHDFANLSDLYRPGGLGEPAHARQTVSADRAALWTDRTAAETTVNGSEYGRTSIRRARRRWNCSPTSRSATSSTGSTVRPRRLSRSCTSSRVTGTASAARISSKPASIFCTPVRRDEPEPDGADRARRRHGRAPPRLLRRERSNDRRHRGGRVCAGPSSAAPALVRRDGPPARSRRGARTREPLAADWHGGAAHRVGQRRDARRVGTVRRADAVDGGCVRPASRARSTRGSPSTPRRQSRRVCPSRTRWRRSSRRRSAGRGTRPSTIAGTPLGVSRGRAGQRRPTRIDRDAAGSRHAVSSGSYRATGIPAIATSNSARTTHAARRRTST